MAKVLKSRAPRLRYGGPSGSLFLWSSTCLKMLKEINFSASKLLLRQNSLALPSYCDSPKIAYVVQGSGTAGMIFEKWENQKVLVINEGDTIAIPAGVVTWFLNKDEIELVIVCMGDTSKSCKNGEFTDFPLTGENAMFTKFSPDVIGKAWGMSVKEVHNFIGKQKQCGIVCTENDFRTPQPKEEDRNDMVVNLLEKLDGGAVFPNLPYAEKVGLSPILERVDGESSTSPALSSPRLTYIVRGKGLAQIDDRDFMEVKAGDLFVVPRFSIVTKIAADKDDMYCFSMFTAMPNHIAGSSSVALNPQVPEAPFSEALAFGEDAQ